MAARRTFPLGPILAIAGAVLLLVSLFLDWYGALSAWTAFELLDLLLAALAIGTIVALLERLAPETRARGVGVIGAGAAVPMSLAALVIVLSQILNHPPAGVDRDPELGIWLALAASALMVLGSILSTARISLALDVERRDAAEAPAASEEPPPPAQPGPRP